jgi:hypothetical protein
MATEFIIVVEVDHQRAQAAYRKGMADLDLIWPQLMAHAEAVDGPRNERIRKDRETYLQSHERYMARLAEHSERVEEWERGGMFRGPRPEMDMQLLLDRPRLAYGGFEYPDMQRKAYESIRNELKLMADIAGAAISPYRMKESQVRGMIAWEDGSRIERIKNEIGNERSEA